MSGYEDGGDAPDKQLKLIPGAREDAKKFLEDKTITQKHFQRVAALVEGFETPFGLELLATVHWVIKTETIKSVDDAVSSIYKWNNRKKQFTKRQIDLAIDVLNKKNWVGLTESGYKVNGNV